ncbi:phage baseplate assembly protein V [uncultured Aquitalea sp.]|uniref:phage baseplate assembly protein V n=1 Tax=uncultured Aquitalea sp. TaxID=540272 RepID=UPI0025F23ADF|nr:phage baseplate assembly protein V [uncultured Aquitalea sp.]
MIRDIDARIQRFLGRIRLPFRGVGGGVSNASAVQLADGEGFKDEPIRGAELMQHYGFTSTPPSGFMYVAVPVGGKTAHAIMVATEHGSYRIKGLKTGEVAIYTDEGDNITLKRGHVVEVNTQTLRINAPTLVEINTQKVQMNAQNVATTGNVAADGDITDQAQGSGKSMANMRSVYDSHGHPVNNITKGGDSVVSAAPNQQV